VLRECGRNELPRARAGLAAGRVLIRGGDYFGTVVNLASRLVEVAPAGGLAVDEAFRDSLQDRRAQSALEPLALQDLKGIGTTSVWLLNQQGPRRRLVASPAV
jgi:adenylate cyclase